MKIINMILYGNFEGYDKLINKYRICERSN